MSMAGGWSLDDCRQRVREIETSVRNLGARANRAEQKNAELEAAVVRRDRELELTRAALAAAECERDQARTERDAANASARKLFEEVVRLQGESRPSAAANSSSGEGQASRGDSHRATPR